jgi:FlgD Ig-like domain
VRRHAATAVVLALLIGTAIAFAETERLKLEPTAIEESFVQTAFSPTCGCEEARAEIRLRLHRADEATVRILDSKGEVVRVLVDHRHLPPGRTRMYWNGRAGGGEPAPDGAYRVDVRLARAGRTFELPRKITLDTVAPEIRLRSYTDRAQLGARVRVFYRVNEPAHGVLYIEGVKTVGPTYTKSRAAKLQWQPRRSGRYRLRLAAVDLAGNLGGRTPLFVVRITG